MNYLLSIIVPVKNNYEYIKMIINNILIMDSAEVELLIQDNTAINNEIVEFIESIDNKNVRYFHNSNSLTMTENFELGIKNSTGEYICILGADDNISSKIINVVKYLSSEKIDSAVFRKAFYNWPGMKFRAHSNLPSLTIYKSSGRIFPITIDDELKSLLMKGMVSLGRLPEPYHGIIKRTILDEVYIKTGKYIPGACPDMAMAISLSQVNMKHVFIDAPITISGHSYNSAGGKGARGEHKGVLKNQSFLPKDIEKDWPNFIPKVWTAPTIYADSMNSALKAMGKEEKLIFFNREANYANIISFFPNYSNLVNSLIEKNFLMKIKVIRISVWIFFKRLYIYIKNWLSSNLKISKNDIHYNVNSSLQAVELVDQYIETVLRNAPYLKS